MKLEKFSLVGSFFAGLLAGSVLAMVMCCIIKCCRKQKERSVTPEVEIISEVKTMAQMLTIILYNKKYSIN